ncbi:hypothetical protein ACLIBH_10735 [Virgibacillus sp. W0430]|uniref:hypothetical protein n=1 Tax=Virgibacillus sp. W0430 TaxID=3391580 RepID=UPI003F46BD02
MKGKMIVFLIILVTIAVLGLAWFLLQYMFNEFDVDRAKGANNLLTVHLKYQLSLI